MVRNSMKFTFHISTSKADRVFDSATDMDEYIHSVKLPVSSRLTVMCGDKNCGSMLVSDYLKKEKHGNKNY